MAERIRCRVTINWHDLRAGDRVLVDPDEPDVAMALRPENGYLVEERLSVAGPSSSTPAAPEESPEDSG